MSEFKKPILNNDEKLKNFTIKLNKKYFSCTCGCNVFHCPDDTNINLFKCNSCGKEYESK